METRGARDARGRGIRIGLRNRVRPGRAGQSRELIAERFVHIHEARLVPAEIHRELCAKQRVRGDVPRV